MLRFISVLISSLCAIAISTFLALYLSSYYPYKPDLIKSIQAAKIAYSGDLSQIYKLAKAAEGTEGIEYSAARQAYYDLSFSHQPDRSMIKWHLNQMLWYYSNKLNFSDDEVFYIFLSFGHMDDLANKYFNARFMALSFEQKAQIICMLKAPQAFKPGTERGRMRLQWLLSRYERL